MRSPWFLAAVLVALAAAGWAFYTLSSAPRDDEPAGAGSRSSARHDGASSARPRSESGPALQSEPMREAPGDEAASATTGEREPPREVARERPPRGGAPPSVKPSVDLEQARADFQAVLDELDVHAAAGHELENPEWVDLYKRGNEALLPLSQHLHWDVPAEADELRTAQTQLREKLHAVAPRPVDPRP